jgi:hypothetical protein
MARSREWLLSHPEAIVPFTIEADYGAGLRRLAAGEPLPYVLGWWEFYGRRFNLTADVLIPRPETELLVEKGLRAIDEPPRLRAVIDLGSGSGCVGITLALERHGLRVLATDVSSAALSVARSNAAWHGVGSRLDFVKSISVRDWRWMIASYWQHLRPHDRVAGLAWEPRLAADGGRWGRLVAGCWSSLLAGAPAEPRSCSRSAPDREAHSSSSLTPLASPRAPGWNPIWPDTTASLECGSGTPDKWR